MTKLSKEAMREYMRKRREADKVETVTVSRPKESTAEQWHVACERAERSRVYAQKLPEQVRPGDVRFQNAEWQWWWINRKVDKMEYAPKDGQERALIEQHCDACKGTWNSYMMIPCPYCASQGRKAA